MPAGTKAAIYAVYWGQDGGREFEIQVDGKAIASETLAGGKSGFYGVEYPVPKAAIAGRERITVRFQAKPGSTAGGVFDLRLLRAK